MRTIFLRVLETEEKALALMTAVQFDAATNRGRRFEVDAGDFRAIAGAPFAYWVSRHVREIFRQLPPVEGEGRAVRVGMQTSDDFRFARASWEVQSPNRLRWRPFAKGGAFAPYYADIHLLVNWMLDGAEIRSFTREGSDRVVSVVRNE